MYQAVNKKCFYLLSLFFSEFWDVFNICQLFKKSSGHESHLYNQQSWVLSCWNILSMQNILHIHVHILHIHFCYHFFIGNYVFLSFKRVSSIKYQIPQNLGLPLSWLQDFTFCWFCYCHPIFYQGDLKSKEGSQAYLAKPRQDLGLSIPHLMLFSLHCIKCSYDL